jgi:hypothetical protein
MEVSMAVICPPKTKTPPTKTQPKRQTGGWTPRPQPRVALNLGSDDELLLLENRTEIAWTVYHNFHQLGIIDPGELLAFHLCKHGNLNARPCAKHDAVEYLVLPLSYDVNIVYIYKRTMSKDLEIYDMRAFLAPSREAIRPGDHEQ